VSATILIVDDEPDLEVLITQKFRRQIKDGTVSFLFARDGLEALSLLAENADIDMLVSDINMPRMDGLSLLQRLQETEEQVCTVIFSAYGDMVNIRKAMNRGAFDFLTKPIDFSDLEMTIAKTLRHIEVLREARRRQARAEQAHAALSRYFSPNLAERLASDADGLSLLGQRREIAALFTDIEGFTTLVETLGPSEMRELLNGYLAGLTTIVFSYDGTVAKIIGDALHVLFGAPEDQPDHAERAVACALDIDRFSQSFRKEWRERGVMLGPTRIGVNAGSAIVGNFGGDSFFDYTAYGDTINVAARLETANKQFGTRICVSDNVAMRVAGFTGRPIGDLVLKGKSQLLRAYELLGPDGTETPEIRGYLNAFSMLEKGDLGAISAFAAEVGKCPDDRLASFHLKRLLNGLTGARIDMD